MKMKKIITILLAAMMVLSLAACGGGSGSADNSNNAETTDNGTEESLESEESPAEDEAEAPSEAENESDQPAETADTTPGGDTSGSGNESEGSKILVAYFSATNNTEGIAQKLADGLGADLYEIMPEQPYTDEDLDYGDPQSRTSVETNDPDVRPAISDSVENMDQYDVVLIGYPIWWGDAPRIMSTFIESYDFSGKTLAAFCTSGSSGFGDSDSALRDAASSAEWLDGHRFSAGASADDVMEWADSLGLNQN